MESLYSAFTRLKVQHLNLSSQKLFGGGVELSLRDDAPPVELGESRGLGAYLRMRVGQVPHQTDGVTHITQLLKQEKLKISHFKTRKQTRNYCVKLLQKREKKNRALFALTHLLDLVNVSWTCPGAPFARPAASPGRLQGFVSPVRWGFHDRCCSLRLRESVWTLYLLCLSSAQHRWNISVLINYFPN